MGWNWGVQDIPFGYISSLESLLLWKREQWKANYFGMQKKFLEQNLTELGNNKVLQGVGDLANTDIR